MVTKTSKLLRTLCFFLLFHQAFSQVGIEKTSVDGDGILDFPTGTTKGIILPSVTSTNGASEGTLLYDQTDNTIKYYDGSTWQILTSETGAARSQDNTVNEATANQGVIIGSSSSTAKGILVLEATDKALILPKISEPHLNVVNPESGMICYDTTNKTFVVFNGNKWEFFN